MASQTDKVVKIFKAVSQYPSVSSARILKPLAGGSGLTVVSTWSQRNLERGKLMKFQQTHLLDSTLQKKSDVYPVDISFELLSSLSKSEELRSVVREVSVDATTKKQYLEVWKQNQLWKNFDLGALEVHGDVYADGEFGAFEWCPFEEKLLYVAEKKVAKTEPFIKSKPQETRESDIGDVKAVKGEEYLYRSDWGEQLVGKCQPVVAVCEMKTDKLSVLEGIPAHFSPGQVIWAPDGEGVVGVVWENEPRRLGLIFCSNRPSFIFHLTKDGVFSLLSDEGQAVRSPRFSPDGQSLVWLERPALGPHHAAHRLVCYKWNTAQKEIVVDIVQQNISTVGRTPFYGLFNMGLPKRCWSLDSTRILLSTPQKCSVNSYVINIENKHITELQCADGSQSILDVHNDVVICCRSSLKMPAYLIIGKLPAKDAKGNFEWFSITNNETNPALEGLTVHYMTLTQEKEEDESCKSFSAIYIGPESVQEREVPLIVWPHGGPHSAFSDSFSMEAALFGLLGFGILMVNYRGSIGAGQKNVDFLLGRVGDSDVKDVQLATAEALKQFPFLNPNKRVLFGGSHGGFLVTHISGQFPLEYKAVVARNPVTDISSMYAITDIPDWTAVETGYLYSAHTEMSTETLEKMKKSSPINFVHRVVAPTLLLIGKKDIRVPCSQGIHYYHALKAHNVKTRLLFYEDNHPLGQVPVEIDNLINSILWFYQNLE